ncbi:MAG: dienelactone hydrolase family protein [Burkholderiales bacterium]|nr:dienelactone hydrolase family protein [Burkholderiales bacterium]
MKKLMLFIALFFAAAIAQAAVQGKEISYSAQGATMKGYLAFDDAVQGKRPGVLVVHEWWGHNDYARSRANKLAELGYTALAVDMYGDGKQAAHPDDASKFMNAVMSKKAVAKARFEAAMKLLKKQKTVDAKNIAAIGYCFGGGVVLEMARRGVPLKAVASFHGALGTDAPAQPGKIHAKVIAFTGADDPMAPAKVVEEFKQEMDKAGANYKVVSYPGVKHSFTNPAADDYGKRFNMPLAYNAEADQASWAEAQSFLADAFKAK